MKTAKLTKFRELRKQQGINLGMVAKQLNVSKAYISMVETCLLYTSDAADEL